MSNPTSQLEELRIDRAKADRRGSRRWLWFGFSAIIVGVIALSLWARNQAAAPVAAAAASQTQAQTTDAAAPPDGSLLDATGYVVARRQATVSSKITGKLVEVLV